MFFRHPLEKCSTRFLRLILPLFLIATVALAVFFAIEGEVLVHPEAPYGILSFEFIWNLEGLARVVGPWNELTINKAVQLTYIDFGFLVAYSTLLAATAIWLGRRATQNRGISDPLGRGAAWFAWCAAACDAIENAAGLKLLRGTSADPWPFVMSVFATIKFALLAAVLIYLLVCMVPIAFLSRRPGDS